MRKRTVMLLLAAVSLVVAACGGSDDPEITVPTVDTPVTTEQDTPVTTERDAPADDSGLAQVTTSQLADVLGANRPLSDQCSDLGLGQYAGATDLTWLGNYLGCSQRYVSAYITGITLPTNGPIITSGTWNQMGCPGLNQDFRGTSTTFLFCVDDGTWYYGADHMAYFAQIGPNSLPAALIFGDVMFMQKLAGINVNDTNVMRVIGQAACATGAFMTWMHTNGYGFTNDGAVITEMFKSYSIDHPDVLNQLLTSYNEGTGFNTAAACNGYFSTHPIFAS